MRLDQKITLAFCLLGMAFGFVSWLLAGFAAFVFPLIAYLAALSFLILNLKLKTPQLFNTLIFWLAWLVCWILLFNTI